MEENARYEVVRYIRTFPARSDEYEHFCRIETESMRSLFVDEIINSAILNYDKVEQKYDTLEDALKHKSIHWYAVYGGGGYAGYLQIEWLEIHRILLDADGNDDIRDVLYKCW